MWMTLPSSRSRAAPLRAVREDVLGPRDEARVRVRGDLGERDEAERAFARMHEALAGFQQCGCEATDLDRIEALAYGAFGAHDVRWVPFDPRRATGARTVGEWIEGR